MIQSKTLGISAYTEVCKTPIVGSTPSRASSLSTSLNHTNSTVKATSKKFLEVRILDAKTAQNGEHKPNPLAARGQAGGQAGGQPVSPLLLVYETLQRYQQLADFTSHCSHWKRWLRQSVIHLVIQKLAALRAPLAAEVPR